MPQISERKDSDTCILENRRDSVVLGAETLRNVSQAANDAARAGKKEDRFSVFWRVFGTTILSIGALVVITVYQQFTSALSELRSNVNHLSESRGDLIKTDEFNNRMSSMWSSLKDLQGDKAAFSALRERSALVEQQIKDGQEQVNSRLVAMGANLKEVESNKAALETLKERLALLEQQAKAGDEERKELVRDLQLLREREAALEGRQGLIPPGTHVEKLTSGGG